MLATFWLLIALAVCLAVLWASHMSVRAKVGVVLFVAVVIAWPAASALFGIYYPPANCPLGLPERYC